MSGQASPPAQASCRGAGCSTTEVTPTTSMKGCGGAFCGCSSEVRCPDDGAGRDDDVDAVRVQIGRASGDALAVATQDPNRRAGCQVRERALRSPHQVGQQGDRRLGSQARGDERRRRLRRRGCRRPLVHGRDQRWSDRDDQHGDHGQASEADGASPRALTSAGRTSASDGTSSGWYALSSSATTRSRSAMVRGLLSQQGDQGSPGTRQAGRDRAGRHPEAVRHLLGGQAEVPQHDHLTLGQGQSSERSAKIYSVARGTRGRGRRAAPSPGDCG